MKKGSGRKGRALRSFTADKRAWNAFAGVCRALGISSSEGLRRLLAREAGKLERLMHDG